MVGSKLKSTLEYMWTWLSSWVVALVDVIPSTRARKAISPLLTYAIVAIIVVAGVAAIYFIVISPGSSTSTYP